jgi:hypothetical protein
MGEVEANNSKSPTTYGSVAIKLWAKITPEHKKFALRTVLAGFTTYLISRVMTTYSGTTLLFPKSWREIVIGLASLLGILLFELGHEKRKKSSRLDKDHDEQLSKRLRKRIWFTFAGLVLSVCAFFFLRGYCVYHFDPTQWLTTQALADRDRADKIRAAGDTTMADTVLAADRQAPEKDKDLQEGSDQSNLDALVPEFVNREQHLICLPLWLPYGDRGYVKYLHNNRHDDGIRVLLDEQPGTIINWLTSDARMNMQVTTLVFLANYLLIIALATYLLGMRFDPVQSVWEAMFGVG